MKKILLVSVAAVNFCACASISPTLTSSVRKTNRNLTAIEEARELEATKPDQAAKAYRGIIARADQVLNRPISEHSKQLEENLNAMGNSSGLVLKDESAAAFPFVYDRWVVAAARANLGLARLAWARSDLPELEGKAKTALDLFQKKAGLPIVMAKGSLECYELLRQAYSRQGKVGRERLVRLNQDLIKDYLHSQQGRNDFYAEKKAESEAIPEVAKADNFIAQVNQQRAEKNAAQWQQAMGALQQVGNMVQQHEMDKYAAQHGGQLTPQMEMSKMAMNFQSQMAALNPSYKKGMDMANAWLSPFTNQAAGRQLLDPSYGTKAPQLIKTFANAAAELSGSDKMRKAAQLVSSSVDTVTQVRGGNPQEVTKALTGFAQSFDSLATQVGAIEKTAAR